MKKEYMDWRKYGNICNILAYQIKKDPRKIVGVYGIPRGGLSLAVYMSHRLNIPYVHDLWSFSDKENYLLVCDDISDTGRSLNDILARFRILGFKTPIFATLHYKPKTVMVPDYYWGTTDKWFVYPWETEDSEPSEYHKKVYPELDECVLGGNATQDMLDSVHSLKKEIHHYDSGGDDLGICEFLDDISNGRSIE